MPSPPQQARSEARESLALPFFLLFCRIIAIPCKVYFFFSNPLPCPHKAGFLEHTTNFYCRTFALFYIKVEKPSFSTFMYFLCPFRSSVRVQGEEACFCRFNAATRLHKNIFSSPLRTCPLSRPISDKPKTHRARQRMRPILQASRTRLPAEGPPREKPSAGTAFS